MDRRSHSGCWTCRYVATKPILWTNTKLREPPFPRVRRKKCDEGSPSCAKCQSLGLPCHGFGPRPSWMDGGPRQRAKSLEFKETIKLRPRQPRHNRNDSEGQVELLQNEMMLTSCASRSTDILTGTLPTELLTPAPTITLPSPVSTEAASSSRLISWDTFPSVFDTGFELSPNTAPDAFNMVALTHTSPPVANFEAMDPGPSASMERSTYLQQFNDKAMHESKPVRDHQGLENLLSSSARQHWDLTEETWSHHRSPNLERSTSKAPKQN